MGTAWLAHRAFILDFKSIGQVIMFSDLECDYINPIDLCNKLNQVCGFLLLLCLPKVYDRMWRVEMVRYTR
jgi:hypothetical protein